MSGGRWKMGWQTMIFLPLCKVVIIAEYKLPDANSIEELQHRTRAAAAAVSWLRDGWVPCCLSFHQWDIPKRDVSGGIETGTHPELRFVSFAQIYMITRIVSRQTAEISFILMQSE